MIGVCASLISAEADPARVRVVIADADPFARRTVRDTLQKADGIVVAADAQNAREALELAAHYRPDVILVESTLGDLDLVRLLSQCGHVAVLATHYDEEEALAALRAGAMACLDKHIDPSELQDVVRKLAGGEAVVSPGLAARVLECLREIPDTGWRPVRSRLTSREWEIVDLMGEGASTQSIAERLVLSPATVYSHVKSVLRKLGVHSRPDAVSAAERLRHEEAAPLN
jgi:DNA-binding NarL/FixJ family response regulator